MGTRMRMRVDFESLDSKGVRVKEKRLGMGAVDRITRHTIFG